MENGNHIKKDCVNATKDLNNHIGQTTQDGESQIMGLFHNFDNILWIFCGYSGGFECLVIDLHTHLSQGDHLAHLQDCGCAGCAGN